MLMFDVDVEIMTTPFALQPERLSLAGTPFKDTLIMPKIQYQVLRTYLVVIGITRYWCGNGPFSRSPTTIKSPLKFDGAVSDFFNSHPFGADDV